MRWLLHVSMFLRRLQHCAEFCHVFMVVITLIVFVYNVVLMVVYISTS
jgi:hypothetical protein